MNYDMVLGIIRNAARVGLPGRETPIWRSPGAPRQAGSVPSRARGLSTSPNRLKGADTFVLSIEWADHKGDHEGTRRTESRSNERGRYRHLRRWSCDRSVLR